MKQAIRGRLVLSMTEACISLYICMYPAKTPFRAAKLAAFHGNSQNTEGKYRG